MRILLLPRYGPRGASSRYRLWQYVSLLKRAGHRVEVRPLLDDGYLEKLYSTGRRPQRWLISGYTRRLADVFRTAQFDAIICEQEVFPFLPASVERLFQRSRSRFLVDFDDSAHDKYSKSAILRNKIPRLMAAADAVIVGNNYLAEYARQFARQVYLIPSVVDLSGYGDRTSFPASRVVRVGWIGTPVTANLLKDLLPLMKRLQSQHPGLVFRFIGAGPDFDLRGLQAELPPWSEETEAGLLLECDIGIMPLPDNEFTRGKCGLKLIQYMATGLPVVASPVGVNCEIVDDGKNGYLAGSPEQWLDRLDMLVRDPELRLRFGRAGRAKVAAGYTLEYGFSKWQEILEGTSSSGFSVAGKNNAPVNAVAESGWK